VPRHSDARARAVATTARLLQERGYAATGVAQILAVSGAPKGSFYFYFPNGKDQIVAEALRLSGAQVERTLRRLATETTSPAELIAAFVDREVSQLVDSGYRLGCPIATVALELSSESEAIHTACQEIFASWIAALAGSFVAQLGDRSNDFAEHVIVALEGGLLLSRVQRNPAPLRRVRDDLIAEIAWRIRAVRAVSMSGGMDTIVG
jgi:TetR/AcrR family transcriptional repressor of lmrAB and yxaGH operons